MSRNLFVPIDSDIGIVVVKQKKDLYSAELKLESQTHRTFIQITYIHTISASFLGVKF